MKKRRKIFQRAAALLCCIVLLSSLVAVPVHAADDSEFFDVLEFCTANDSGSQVVSGSLPMSVIYRTVQEPFRYIDMVVITDIADLFITYAGRDLTTVLIGTDYGYTYRVYGDLVGDPSGYLAFTVGGSSGSWISFEQMKVSSFTYSQSIYPSVGTLVASPYEYNPREEMTDPSVPVRITLDYNSVQTFAVDYWATFTISDWRKFDYIDVLFQAQVATVESIVVTIDDLEIPHSISYLDSSLESDLDWEDNSMFGDLSLIKCLVRLDLTEVNRTLSSSPTISVNGLYSPCWEAYVQLDSVTGYVVAESSSPLGTFWKNLVSTLNQHFEGLKEFLQGLFSGDDEFESEVDQGVSDFEDAESGMDEGLDSLETPDVDDIDIVGIIGDSGADTSTLGDFFAAAFDNVVVNWLMIMSFSFMLISFLLYGSFR